MNTELKAYEESIRKDERRKLTKKLERIKIHHLSIATLLDEIKYEGVKDNLANGSAPQAKAKRKPVAVDQELIFKVGAVLDAYPNTPMTPGEVKDELPTPFSERSTRAIGAALRALVQQVEAIEQPRGKFKAVASADGAST